MKAVTIFAFAICVPSRSLNKAFSSSFISLELGVLDRHSACETRDSHTYAYNEPPKRGEHLGSAAQEKNNSPRKRGPLILRQKA